MTPAAAKEAFEQLAARLVRGEDTDPNRTVLVLAAAGKSFEDLERRCAEIAAQSQPRRIAASK